MKRLSLLLVVIAGMMLTACGAGEPLTTEEVIEQTVQANAELESYSADMNIETEVMGMEVSMEALADITHNPDTMYMEMKMGMTGITMDVEVYVAGEEVYMNMFGEWLIVEGEEIGLDSFDQLNKEEMEKLKEFEEYFEMTEEDDVYVLTLSGEGEEFQKLIEPYLEGSMGDLGMDPALEENFSDIVVNRYDMEMSVDKDTMILQSQTVDADLEVDGETMGVRAETTISAINEVEPVEIPQEARENAVTEEEVYGDFEYTDMEMPLEEIKETVSFTVPDVTSAPEGYELIGSYYYEDEMMEMVYLMYEKDTANNFVVNIYPSLETYGEIYEDEHTENVDVNGSKAVLEVIDESFMFLTWEHASGALVEVIGEGPELTKELLVEIAEGIE